MAGINLLQNYIAYTLFVLISCSTTAIYAQSQRNADKFEGYLFAYFEGSGEKMEQEQLRFALSQDVINWTALHNNQPIIASAEISQNCCLALSLAVLMVILYTRMGYTIFSIKGIPRMRMVRSSKMVFSKRRANR